MKNTSYIIAYAACLLTGEMTFASVPVTTVPAESQATANVVTPEIIQRIEAERKENEALRAEKRARIESLERKLENQALAYEFPYVVDFIQDIISNRDTLAVKEFMKKRNSMIKSDEYKKYESFNIMHLNLILDHIARAGVPLRKNKLLSYEDSDLEEKLEELDEACAPRVHYSY